MTPVFYKCGVTETVTKPYQPALLFMEFVYSEGELLNQAKQSS